MRSACCAFVAVISSCIASDLSHADQAARAYVDVPVEISFPPLDKAVASQLPPSLQGQESQYGFRIDYQVDRRDVRVSARGNTLRTEADFEYSVEACKDMGRLGCVRAAGCSRQHVTATLESEVELTRNWAVRLTTTALPITHRTRCQVTPLKIDVTDRIVEVLQEKLEEALGDIDARVARRLSFRSQVETLWSHLDKPQAVGKFHVVLGVESVAAGPIALTTTSASVDVQLGMKPRLFLGSLPGRRTRSLPPLGKLVSRAPPGFRGEFSVVMGMAEINEQLASWAAGQVIDLGANHGKLTLSGLQATGAKGRLAARLTFSQPENLRVELDIKPWIMAKDHVMAFKVPWISISGLKKPALEKQVEEQIRAYIQTQTLAPGVRTSELVGLATTFRVDKTRRVEVRMDKVALSELTIDRSGITLAFAVEGGVKLGE